MRNELVETMIRAGIAALIVFATIMLAVGERSVVLMLTTLIAVAVSIYVTDVRKVFHLTQSVADCVALGIVVVSAANMLYIDRAGQIGAVGNLQSYMQYVLLFQPKTPRVYWQLGLLSLGQVAIAATLVPGPLFGAMLFVYLLIGFVTYTLLMSHGEASRCLAPPTRTVRPTRNVDLRTRLPADHRPLLRGSVAAVPAGLRWGLLQPTATMCLVTFCVAGLLFFLIPRPDRDRRSAQTDAPTRAVGFSKTITLGELGEVIQSPDAVMRIEFFRGLSEQAFELAEEPLLRGSVVTRYDNGAWSQTKPERYSEVSREVRGPFVRQRITVEPLDVAELFCVNPVFTLRDDQRLQLDASCGQLLRREDHRAEKMTFEVATTGIQDNSIRKYVPRTRSLQSSSQQRLVRMPKGPDGISDPFVGLRATSARVLSDAGVDASDRVAAARALHNYLKYSGRYTYSLEWQPRNHELDPLEDFVTEHPVGHCEYFAGALVLMLRSQGIPARMAIGFKGGEWNPLGMYYQVQQLHAHAWVEVYLSSADIPPDTFGEAEAEAEAAWFILDPTVSVEAGDDGNQRVGLMARVRQSIDYAQVLWSKYIVGLNFERQNEGIYAPIRAGALAAYDNLFGQDTWRRRMRAVSRSPVGAFWEWYRRHWFSWRGGLVAVLGSLLLAACFLGARWLTQILRQWTEQLRHHGPHEPPTLEMYRRLEIALAGQGFVRATGQTAREFAVDVGGHLAESIEWNRVSHLPRRIVESFYRVRFGGSTLDNQEADAVEHALCDLERTLAGKS